MRPFLHLLASGHALLPQTISLVHITLSTAHWHITPTTPTRLYSATESSHGHRVDCLLRHPETPMGSFLT